MAVRMPSPAVWRAEHTGELVGDVIDRAISVNGNQQALTIEAMKQGRRLVLECVEPLTNTGGGFVGAASRRESVCNDLVGSC